MWGERIWVGEVSFSTKSLQLRRECVSLKERFEFRGIDGDKKQEPHSKMVEPFVFVYLIEQFFLLRSNMYGGTRHAE